MDLLIDSFYRPGITLLDGLDILPGPSELISSGFYFRSGTVQFVLDTYEFRPGVDQFVLEGFDLLFGLCGVVEELLDTCVCQVNPVKLDFSVHIEPEIAKEGCKKKYCRKDCDNLPDTFGPGLRGQKPKLNPAVLGNLG